MNLYTSNRWDVPILRREPTDKVKNNMRIGRCVRNWGGYNLVFVDEPVLFSELSDLSFPIVRKCVIGFISADDRKKKTKGVKRMLGSEKFIDMCKSTVVDYWNEKNDPTNYTKLKENDVFVVWYCKTLQNHKALLSTTISDGMYYELTYNGDKNELYFDAYKKWENRCIEVTDEF